MKQKQGQQGKTLRSRGKRCSNRTCAYGRRIQPLSNFWKESRRLDGRSSLCVLCGRNKNKKAYSRNRQKRLDYSRRYNNLNRKAINKKAVKQYYKNRKKILSYKNRYRASHRLEISQANKLWRDSNRRRIARTQKDYRKKNKVKLRIKAKEYYRSSKFRRVSSALRARLRQGLKNYRAGRGCSAVRDLGCSLAEVVAHLEKQWAPGMSWSNYGSGKNKWNIDHIRPMYSFNLSDVEQQRKAVHFSNLRPLWQEDNLRRPRK